MSGKEKRGGVGKGRWEVVEGKIRLGQKARLKNSENLRKGKGRERGKCKGETKGERNKGKGRGGDNAGESSFL